MSRLQYLFGIAFSHVFQTKIYDIFFTLNLRIHWNIILALFLYRKLCFHATVIYSFFFVENLIEKYLYILFLVLMLDIKIVVRAGKKTFFSANFAYCCFQGKFWNMFFKISIASNSFWNIMLKFHWDCIGKTGH